MDESSIEVRRVGAIGDVHCQTDALEKALKTLENSNVDAILCVGDIVDGPGDADLTCRLLASKGVHCVAGNHERWLLSGERRSLPHATQRVSEDTRAFLASLPTMRMYDTPCGGLMLCHGVGEDDEAMLRPGTQGYGLQDITTLRELMLDPKVDFMIAGHTHERMVREFVGLVVINVGTLYEKFEQSFAIVDFDAQEVVFYSAATDRFGQVLEVLALPIPKKAA